jgi:GntR family transcriptional regulator / MocR family aminotransferase
MDLHISLRRGRTLSAEVYRQIRDAILTGKLRGGEALPSSRALAGRLDVSRNTIMEAFDRLRAEGFLETRVGSGTFVRAGIASRPTSGLEDSPLRARAAWRDIPDGKDLSATSPRFDFRPGIPDARLFPFPGWRARHARQLRLERVGKGSHIDAGGHPALRHAVARHVSLSRGVRATAKDVFVTNGSQQALDLLIRVLLEPGDRVAVEDPGYPLTGRALQAYGCRVCGVPVDENGLVVAAIPDGCRMVHVTPSHQYPLGMAMSMDRRQALIEWARRADAVIVEDDYDSEFRFAGRPLEPLQGLDTTGRVIYLGSFFKVMLPTLRIGFAVLPEPLHSAFRKAKYLADWHTEVAGQVAIAEFIDDGLLGRHIRRMQRVYARRHDRILEILQRDFRSRLEPVPAHGGIHVAALLQDAEPRDDAKLADGASGLGVAVFPLSYHFRDHLPRPGLLFGYGAIATGDIDEGLDRLRRCL